jgi:two-component system response regulator HydG
MASLHFYESERELFIHYLRPGRTIIGRSDRCDVALPSDSVSRVHFSIEQRPDGWWVQDRSRHGTTINGERIERHAVTSGDRIEVGAYTAIFAVEPPETASGATTAAPTAPASHEALLDVGESGVATLRAELHIVRGPRKGDSIQMNKPRSSVGGAGADVRLANDLPRHAFFVRVVRGRVMIEPGETSVSLAGTRVRELTPVLDGEEIRVGDHGLVAQTEARVDRRADVSSFGDMVGQSPCMANLFGILARIAPHDDPVLITGPSGTGKELAARGLHEQGSRRDAPFIAVNCAAITETLFESELFGHEKGAFTGATQRQAGAFQQADGGTLFLDEIGELRLESQAKLLRALESGEVRRVGGASVEYPDVRIIAATNRNLPEMVRAGTFREDLYFRLAILTVRMPGLRDRTGDIPLIARTLLRRHHPSATLAASAIATLERHPWPGNIRELKNVLTRAFVLGGPQITADTLAFDPWYTNDGPEVARTPAEPLTLHTLRAAISRHGGNRTKAAQELGIPRSTLNYKLQILTEGAGATGSSPTSGIDHHVELTGE